MVARPPPHHLAFPSLSLSPKALRASPPSSFNVSSFPCPERAYSHWGRSKVVLLLHQPRRERSIQHSSTSLMVFAACCFWMSRSMKDLKVEKSSSALTAC